MTAEGFLEALRRAVHGLGLLAHSQRRRSVRDLEILCL